ncbi:MAG: hypothetical protein H6679_02805 [Epsilonproteobacteria bacterium]|nr:hypothetical protein [Campylobacterota bacterium]
MKKNLRRALMLSILFAPYATHAKNPIQSLRKIRDQVERAVKQIPNMSVKELLTRSKNKTLPPEQELLENVLLDIESMLSNAHWCNQTEFITQLQSLAQTDAAQARQLLQHTIKHTYKKTSIQLHSFSQSLQSEQGQLKNYINKLLPHINKSPSQTRSAGEIKQIWNHLSALNAQLDMLSTIADTLLLN